MGPLPLKKYGASISTEIVSHKTLQEMSLGPLLRLLNFGVVYLN